MQKMLLPSEPVSQYSCTNLPKTADNDRNTKYLILTYGEWDIPEKIQTGRFEDILFWNSPGVLRFVNLPLEIPEKTIFQPWKFCKIVWHPFETPKSKIKTHLNSTWVFLKHPWKFNLLLNWPLQFPHALSSTPIEIPCFQPPLLFSFFWNSPMLLSGQVPHTIGFVESLALWNPEHPVLV